MAQLVEYDLAKVGVAGSSPVSRSYTKDKGGFPEMEVRFFVHLISSITRSKKNIEKLMKALKD